MIKLKLIHELYQEDLITSIKTKKEKIEELEIRIKPIIQVLQKYEYVIDNYTNITYKSLLKLSEINDILRIKFPVIPIYHKGKEVNWTAIKMYIEAYAKVNKYLLQAKADVNRLEKQKISYTLFRKIIIKANFKIITKIIESNYLFSPLKSFGSIGIIVNHNERKRVNWGISNKNKKDLIAKGLIPYKKEDALKAKKEGKEYKGIEYLVYHPTTDYFLHWFKTAPAINYNVFLKSYKFKPARGGNSSITTRFSKFKKTIENISQVYTRTLNKRNYESA